MRVREGKGERERERELLESFAWKRFIVEVDESFSALLSRGFHKFLGGANWSSPIAPGHEVSSLCKTELLSFPINKSVP